jgi:sterol desaturase/sphingolipid hydroxylase (fatty acid hydroxylase superfamily)
LYFDRLKQKWGITTNKQLIVVFIVFGITGSMSVRVAEPFLSFIELSPKAFEDIVLGSFIYWILRIFVIFPLYQILLMFFGTIFFEFRFFWNFEKKILRRIGLKRFLNKD